MDTRQTKKLNTVEGFNLPQCFFGEYLLKIYPENSVAIVESEKSALIASAVFPDLIWLAAGNLNGLSIEKAKVLKGRNVTLFPDLGGYEKWSEKSNEIQKQCDCKISMSTLLENEATVNNRTNGLDIADYIIAELKSTKNMLEIQNHFSQKLQSMIEEYPALLLLIDKLQLEEI